MSPTLSQLNLVCSDPDASIAFYRRLGVEITDAGVWRTASGAHHANGEVAATQGALDFGFDSVRFAEVWNAGWKGRTDLAGRVLIGFSVPTREDVDALYADLTGAGHPGLQPPCDAIWGARFAIVADPDGVAVGIMSPASAAHRSPAPEI